MVSKAKTGRGNMPKKPQQQPRHPVTGRFVPQNTIVPASHPSAKPKPKSIGEQLRKDA
jgi:hypothetical protein